MQIQPVSVNRNKGFWSHPDLPLEKWGEVITKVEFDSFQKVNNLKVHIVGMDDDGTESFVDAWYDDGLDDCSPWVPTPPTDNSFLLSIHDTEDGPVAWFAEPVQ